MAPSSHVVSLTMRRFVAVAFVISQCAMPAFEQGPLQYRFVERTTGSYARTQFGRVISDGSRWRVDVDLRNDDVVAFTRLVRRGDGSVVAINDTNHTWYRPASTFPLASHTPLFGFGINSKVQNIRIAFDDLSGSSRDAEPAG